MVVRLTINLDEKIYRVAKAQAELQQGSISEVLNDMLRRALETPPSGAHLASTSGFPAILGGPPLTADDVARSEADDDERILRLIPAKK